MNAPEMERHRDRRVCDKRALEFVAGVLIALFADRPGREDQVSIAQSLGEYMSPSEIARSRLSAIDTNRGHAPSLTRGALIARCLTSA